MQVNSKPERPFWVVAHRGVRTDKETNRIAPENTIPAFQEAARYGAAIELDVMTTADGKLAIHHDWNTGRIFKIAGKQKPVSQTSWKELANAKLNVQQHEADVNRLMGKEAHYQTPDKFLTVSTPQLDTVLDEVPDTHIFVELKAVKGKKQDLAKAVVDTIHRKQAKERVTVISFDAYSLRQVKEQDPSIRTALNFTLPTAFRNNKPFLWAYTRLFAKGWAKADGLQPNYASATPTLVKLGHSAGMPVVPWVNDETRAQEQATFPRLLAMGVDGIITNAVDLLKQTMGKSTSEAPPNALSESKAQL